MALPNQLKSGRMSNATIGDQIDNHVGDLEQAICDILGLPINTNITAALFGAGATGLTGPLFQNTGANPMTPGLLQRNTPNLVFHDGNDARRLFIGHVFRKASTQTRTLTTTLAFDDTLVIPILPNELWKIRLDFMSQFDVGGLFKFSLVAPAGASGRWFGYSINSANVLTAHRRNTALDGSAVLQHTSDAPVSTVIEAFVVNGGTSGNVGLQWAQVNSVADNTQVLLNSFIEGLRYS